MRTFFSVVSFYRHSHTSEKLSLEMQKCDVFVVDIFDMAETTCTYYVKIVEKLRKNPDSVFGLPTFKSIITEIEEKNSEDGEPVYQYCNLFSISICNPICIGTTASLFILHCFTFVKNQHQIIF